MPEIPVYDLKILKGFTKSQLFKYTEESGLPISLAEKKIRFFLRNGAFTLLLESGNSPTANGSGIFIENEAAGEFRLYLTDEETILFPIGKGTWLFALIETLNGVETNAYPLIHGKANTILLA